jgi:peptidoglycan/LPS O-acetylase OafA/YrhL
VSGSDRIASLDLLRGMAALVVAGCHFLVYQNVSPTFSEAASAIAVEVFFVLSGFVLAPQIMACAKARRSQALRTFLVRRWMRTVPPYLVALACVSAMLAAEPKDVLRYALYAQNLFYQANDSDYFPVAWSLSVEEWFYVTFPALAVLAAVVRGRGDRTTIAVAAVAFIVAISMVRFFAADLAHWGYEVRRVVIFRIDSIGYGVLLFLAVNRWSRMPNIFVSSAVALFAGAAAFLTLLAVEQVGSMPAKQLFPFAAALFGASAILLFLSLGAMIERAPSSRATAIFLGRISYSIYLFHLVALMIIASFVDRDRVLLSWIVYITGLVGFCSLFYEFFEKPILAARPPFRFAAPPLAAARVSSSLT